jgi:phage shock protein B
METDETKMVQEIYQGLSDMEERVEALETILLDREKDRKGKQA